MESKSGRIISAMHSGLTGRHVCVYCKQEICACPACPECGLRGGAHALGKHGYIPDPITIKEAAEARGVAASTVYQWARRGKIAYRKSVPGVRSAPLFVSAYEVGTYEPGKRGWQTGIKKCPLCAGPFSLEHNCPLFAEACDFIIQGKRLGDLPFNTVVTLWNVAANHLARLAVLDQDQAPSEEPDLYRGLERYADMIIRYLEAKQGLAG